ncbi:methyltransferase [Euphorbia peplus]|nr:methyltransferase [Euphorbia peplus]
MEPAAGKPSFLRNIMARVLFFGVLIIIVRFAYIVTLAGESCNLGDFCFFSLPENFNFVTSGAGAGAATVNKAVRPAGQTQKDLYTSKDWIKSVQFYSSVFQDLISDGYLTPTSKSLCVETPTGQDVFALKEIGVSDSIGVFKKASKPLVISSKTSGLPFDDDSFDFVFSGRDGLSRSPHPGDLADEIARIMKPEGFLVVHVRAKDTYSFNSFLDLFNSCKLIKSHNIDGYDSSMPYIREIVLKKLTGVYRRGIEMPVDKDVNKCAVQEHKLELIRNAEPLIQEEPLKPWLTLKRNIKNVRYLPSLVDIGFKNRYVYVDVGARSYGSSIGSWFKKQYPKQNRTFDVYAIEADKTFHDEYKVKKGVTLLPYAAWVRNETLSFEINGDPGKEVQVKGRGMGRIQPVTVDKSSFKGEVDVIQGFDFAAWLKKTVSDKDFVVMKMDVEGTEFDLIPRLFKTGAICLIDEIFLECHYNRWQRCCPGQRSAKYEKTYGQCLQLFNTLRDNGVLVHQWW